MNVATSGAFVISPTPAYRCARAGYLLLAGMDWLGRLRPASRLADQAIGHQRSRAVLADIQVQPRRRTVAVRGIARRCGDAFDFVGWAKAHLRRAHHQAFRS